MDALATGQIYTADQAVKNGLVDKIGFLEDAVDRAIELADLDRKKVKVVRYKQEAGLSSILLGGQSSESRIAGSQGPVGDDNAQSLLPCFLAARTGRRREEISKSRRFRCR